MSVVAKHAKVVTSIWRDRDFTTKLTWSGQWLYFVLLSQPSRSLVGVVPFQPRKWARAASDVDIGVVDGALEELERHRFIMVDGDTEEVLIRTYVRHDPTRGSAITALWRAWEAVDSEPLRRQIIRELPVDIWSIGQSDPASRSDPPPNGRRPQVNHPYATPPIGGGTTPRTRHACARAFQRQRLRLRPTANANAYASNT